MFCDKSENNSIGKICKRTVRLIYETKDFENILERNEFVTIHESNIHPLQLEIYNSNSDSVKPS